MLIVIKVGGALLSKNFDNVIDDIVDIYLNKKDKYKLVIIHGGGPQINELLRQMNKEPKYFNTPSGYKTRYTDQEAIEAAIMALAGKNNKRLVESLQKRNVNAFGLSGFDGGIIEAKRKDKILVLIDNKRIMKRGEYSGKVIKAENKVLKFFIKNDIIPIIASLAKSEDGEIVNVDGDRAASCVAESLNADILISLTDVDGIYRNFEKKDSLIKKITSTKLKDLLDELEGGMKKKAYAALEALDKNLKKVIITSGESLNPIYNALENKTGTVITNE
ncbi:MAG: [LysW]-aminoadipate kinase [Candidatus Lokiarchaeota archaeon]|nr:[LysW]-aminoadipate kinase [Candidatus Lokiarchaeota archaeon]